MTKERFVEILGDAVGQIATGYIIGLFMACQVAVFVAAPLVIIAIYLKMIGV